MVVCLKQAFQKIWILCSKNIFSISHYEFWGLSSFRQQLSGFLENWQETLWVLSVLLSCLQPALTSGPLLSLWSLVVTGLATMARSISPEHALSQGSHVSLFTGAQQQPQSTHVACFRHCHSHVLGIGLLGSLNISGASVPAPPSAMPRFSVANDHLWTWLLSLSSWVRFGGFAAVCKSLDKSLEPHYHRLKRFSQEAISVFRDKKGE